MGPSIFDRHSREKVSHEWPKPKTSKYVFLMTVFDYSFLRKKNFPNGNTRLFPDYIVHFIPKICLVLVLFTFSDVNIGTHIINVS